MSNSNNDQSGGYVLRPQNSWKNREENGGLLTKSKTVSSVTDADWKDSGGSDNKVPLTPQWLLSKPGEGRNNSNPPEISRSGSVADPSRELRLGLEEKKRDWWRQGTGDRESNDGGKRDRWGEDERDSSVLSRPRERWMKDGNEKDKWGGDNEYKKERWQEGMPNRDSPKPGFEARREGRWSRWGNDDREKDHRKERWNDMEKELPVEKGAVNHENEKEGDMDRSKEKPWRPQTFGRGRGENVPANSTNRFVPGFGVGRGREEGLGRGREEGLGRGREEGLGRGREEGFGRGRGEGFGRGRGTGMAGGSGSSFSSKPIASPSSKTEVVSMATSPHSTIGMKYSRDKLLELYRKLSSMDGFGSIDDSFPHIPLLTSEEAFIPLAFTDPEEEESTIIHAIRNGEVVNSGAIYAPTKESMATRVKDEGQSPSGRGRGRGKPNAHVPVFDSHREDDFFDAPGFSDVSSSYSKMIDELAEARFADAEKAQHYVAGGEVEEGGGEGEGELENFSSAQTNEDMKEYSDWKKKKMIDSSKEYTSPINKEERNVNGVKTDGIWKSNRAKQEESMAKNREEKRVESAIGEETQKLDHEKKEVVGKEAGKERRKEDSSSNPKVIHGEEQTPLPDTAPTLNQPLPQSMKVNDSPSPSTENATAVLAEVNPSITVNSSLFPPEKLCMYYRDPQGDIQGPFFGYDIIEWFSKGYFGLDLPVRLTDKPQNFPFQPLVNIMPHLKPKERVPPGFNSVEKEVSQKEDDSSSTLGTKLQGHGLLSPAVTPASGMVKKLDGVFAQNKTAVPTAAGTVSNDIMSSHELLSSSNTNMYMTKSPSMRKRMSAFPRVEGEGEENDGGGSSKAVTDLQTPDTFAKSTFPELSKPIIPSIPSSDTVWNKQQPFPSTIPLSSSSVPSASSSILSHLSQAEVMNQFQQKQSQQLFELSQIAAGGKGLHSSLLPIPPKPNNPSLHPSLVNKPTLPSEMEVSKLSAIPNQLQAEQMKRFGFNGPIPQPESLALQKQQLEMQEFQKMQHHRLMMMRMQQQQHPLSKQDHALQQQQSQQQLHPSQPFLSSQFHEHLIKPNHQKEMQIDLPVLQPDPRLDYFMRMQSQQQQMHHSLHIQPLPHHVLPHHQPSPHHSVSPQEPSFISSHPNFPFAHPSPQSNAEVSLLHPHEQMMLFQRHQEEEMQRKEAIERMIGKNTPTDITPSPVQENRLTGVWEIDSKGQCIQTQSSVPVDSSDNSKSKENDPSPQDSRFLNFPPVLRQQQPTDCLSKPLVQITGFDLDPSFRHTALPGGNFAEASPFSKEVSQLSMGNEGNVNAISNLTQKQKSEIVTDLPSWIQYILKPKEGGEEDVNKEMIYELEGSMQGKEDQQQEQEQEESSKVNKRHDKSKVKEEESVKKEEEETDLKIENSSTKQVKEGEKKKKKKDGSGKVEKGGKQSSVPLVEESSSKPQSISNISSPSLLPSPSTPSLPTPAPWKPSSSAAKPLAQIQEEEIERQRIKREQRDKDIVEGKPSPYSSPLDANQSSLLTPWKGSTTLNPHTKSLREIQEEEARLAAVKTGRVMNAFTESNRKESSFTDPFLPLPLPLPSAGDPILLRDRVAEQVLVSASMVSQTIPAKETSTVMNVLPNPPILAIPSDDYDFVEAKEGKKGKKKGGRGKPPTPLPVPSLSSPSLPTSSPAAPILSAPAKPPKPEPASDSFPLPPILSLSDYIQVREPSPGPAAWASKPVSKPKPQVSLKEIQESEKRLKELKGNPSRVRTSDPSPPSSTLISASPRPSPSPSPPPVAGASSRSKANSNANAAKVGREKDVDDGVEDDDDDMFWDYKPDLTKKSNPTVQTSSKFPSLSSSKSAVKSKQSPVNNQPAIPSSKPSSESISLMEARAFRKWCKTEVSKIIGYDGINLIDFCVHLPSSREAGEYLTQYLGSSSSAESFKEEFMQKITFLDPNTIKTVFPISDALIAEPTDRPKLSSRLPPAAVPETAPRPEQTHRNEGETKPAASFSSAAGAQAGAGSKKKGKKNAKPLPASFLGFNVTTNRIMVGEIQRVEDL